MLTGYVEYPRLGGTRHFFIRCETDWERYFAAVTDCPNGLPENYSRVQFELAAYSRGPSARATNIEVVGSPLPPIERTCRTCGSVFVLSAGLQAWFQSYKRLPLPWRCADCRRARRESQVSSAVHTTSSSA